MIKVVYVDVGNSPPILIGAGHQRHQQTVSTSTVCNQWLSLAKTLLKVALAGRNHSLVVRTSKYGWVTSYITKGRFTGD